MLSMCLVGWRNVLWVAQEKRESMCESLKKSGGREQRNELRPLHLRCAVCPERMHCVVAESALLSYLTSWSHLTITVVRSQCGKGNVEEEALVLPFLFVCICATLLQTLDYLDDTFLSRLLRR